MVNVCRDISLLSHMTFFKIKPSMRNDGQCVAYLHFSAQSISYQDSKTAIFHLSTTITYQRKYIWYDDESLYSFLILHDALKIFSDIRYLI